MTLSLAQLLKRKSTTTTRIRRLGFAVGMATTAVVLLLHASGLLAAAERTLFDWRTRTFAFFHPPLSDQIIHIDIDDKALASVGRWPWPRSRLAEVVEELDRAGASVVGLDILLDDPQEPRYVPAGQADAVGTPVDDADFVKIDDDANLARALQHVPTILATTFLEDQQREDGMRLAKPVEALRESAAGLGMVSYNAEADQVLRRLPLWFDHPEHRGPSFSLAILAEHLDLDPRRVALDQQLDLPDAHATIPLTEPPHGLDLKRLVSWIWVTWPGTADHWLDMYDAASQHPHHISIARLVEIARLRKQIHASYYNLALQTKSPTVAERYAALLEDDSAEPQQLRTMEQSFVEAGRNAYDMLKGAADDELDAEYRTLRDQLQLWLQVIDQQQNLTDAETELKQIIEGRICLVGWVATGALADFVDTSMYDRCPGVVLHGAMIHAMLTAHMLHTAPPWTGHALILLLGACMTLLAIYLPPLRSVLACLAMVLGFGLINGLWWFDAADTLVTAAGPMTAIFSSWLFVLVYRLIAEQQSRRVITAQFRNYVSPQLVDTLAEQPQTLKQGRAELTCLFGDIAGFTTISEKLGPQRTAELLNRALSDITEALMAHQAYVNKYLGDGVMAVYGAPLDDPQHPLNACRSALEAKQAVHKLNEDLQDPELPTLHLRLGIATGTMMVGDFGAPPKRSDYTVIGDSVNLAARLESANKQFATGILISAQTRELVKDHMLARPIGRVVVKGRAAAEPVYELLCAHEDATDAERDSAVLLEQLMLAFDEARYDAALEHCRKLNASALPALLTDRYQSMCEAGQRGEKIDSTLILTEK